MSNIYNFSVNIITVGNLSFRLHTKKLRHMFRCDVEMVIFIVIKSGLWGAGTAHMVE